MEVDGENRCLEFIAPAVAEIVQVVWHVPAASIALQFVGAGVFCT